MNNINIKGFSILELVISFIIITFVIYGFSLILGKTSMLESYKKNYYYLTYEVNEVNENINNVLSNCKNKELAFTGNEILTSKDNFYNKSGIYIDTMVFLCDNKYITIGISNKIGTGIINPVLKNEDGGFFSIYDSSLSEPLYVNKNINILLFQFFQSKVDNKNIIRGEMKYDNHLQIPNNNEKINNNHDVNYISGSTFFIIK